MRKGEFVHRGETDFVGIDIAPQPPALLQHNVLSCQHALHTEASLQPILLLLSSTKPN